MGDYIDIEKVQKQFDQMMDWDKTEFINRNIRYADEDIVSKFINPEDEDFREECGMDISIMDPEDILEMINIDTIINYVENYKNK